MRENRIHDRAKALFEADGWIFTNYHGAQYSRRGWPDVYVLKDGFHCWIELKQPGKRPNKIQNYWIITITARGGHAFWADDADEALAHASLQKADYDTALRQPS